MVVRKRLIISMMGGILLAILATLALGYFFQKSFSDKETIGVARHTLKTVISEQNLIKLKNGKFQKELSSLPLKVPQNMHLLSSPQESSSGMDCSDCFIEDEKYRVKLFFHQNSKQYFISVDEQGHISDIQEIN